MREGAFQRIKSVAWADDAGVRVVLATPTLSFDRVFLLKKVGFRDVRSGEVFKPARGEGMSLAQTGFGDNGFPEHITDLAPAAATFIEYGASPAGSFVPLDQRLRERLRLDGVTVSESTVTNQGLVEGFFPQGGLLSVSYVHRQGPFWIWVNSSVTSLNGRANFECAAFIRTSFGLIGSYQSLIPNGEDVLASFRIFINGVTLNA